MVLLKEHNKPVYEKLTEMLERENLALLDSCPGSGKSYVLLKYLEDHPGKTLVVCPKNSIKDEWDKAGKDNNISLNTVTYHLISRMGDLERFVNRYDYIVFDEAHHMGANKWQESITKMRKVCPDKKYIGLTATPVRYTDGMRDVGDEFFAGNTVNGATQAEAVEKGILPGYKYVCALFGIPDDPQIYEKIRHLENREENREGVYEAFDQYMPEGDRKGIVFVDRIENIPSFVEIIKGYYDSPCFVINSHISWAKNAKTLAEFDQAKEGWIFVVDMLNEGLHINGVNTIIMFRKTISPNVFIQQLGRSQAAGAAEAVIFDFVGNRKNLKAMGFTPVREGNGTKMVYAEDPRIIIDYVETEAVALLNEVEEQLEGWKPWSEEEEDFLRENYELGSKYCSEHLPGRSVHACVAHARQLGFSVKHKWTSEDDDILRENYFEKGAGFCAKILNRTVEACRHRAAKLGLTQLVRWSEEEKKFLKDNYIKHGSKYCADCLGKSICSIHAQAKKMGLSVKLNNHPWTESEDEFLRENAKKGVPYCASRLGRSEYMCRKRINELEFSKKKSVYWTEEDRKFLRDNYYKGIKYCMEHLGRSQGACINEAKRQGLTTNNTWTPEEDEFIKENYLEHGVEFCAEHLGRSKNACRQRAAKLGLYVNRHWTEEEDEIMKTGYPAYGLDWCVEHLERSRGACRNRARILGLN